MKVKRFDQRCRRYVGWTKTADKVDLFKLVSEKCAQERTEQQMKRSDDARTLNIPGEEQTKQEESGHPQASIPKEHM